MGNKKEIVGHASLYLSATLMAQAITFMSGLLTRRFLGPVQQGVWSLLQVVMTYTSWSNFGATEAISCHIPYHRGRNDFDKAEKVKDSVFSFSLFTAIMVSAGISIFALLNRSHLKAEMFYGLIFLSVILILQRYSTLQICFLRGYKNFSLASRLSICSAVVNALLVILLSYRYQIYGFLWAMGISYCFDLLFVFLQSRLNFKIAIHWKLIWEAVKFGFPIQMAGVVTGIFLSADRVMIAKFLSFHELGLYSVAIMVFNYLRNFSSPVCVVLLPNLHERYGKTGDSRQLKGYMVKAGTFFSNTMPILIGTTWFLIPYVVMRVIPDYTGGISALRCLITAGFFLSLYQTYSYLIALVRKQVILPICMICVAVLAFTLDYFALRAHWGIESVAVVNAVLSFLLFTAVYFVSAPYLFTPLETCKHYLVYITKFGMMMAVIGGASFLSPHSSKSLFQAVISCLAVVLVFLPLWLKMLKEYDLWGLIKRRSSPLLTQAAEPEEKGL